MHEGATSPVPAAAPQQENPSREFRGFFGDQEQVSRLPGTFGSHAHDPYSTLQMDNDLAAAAPAPEHIPVELNKDLHHSPPIGSCIQESSSDEDDVPRRDRRLGEYRQHSTSTMPSTMPLQDHRAFQKPAKAANLSTGKIYKKPGPKPWAAKPIAKNDMKAKMEVIRAIERNWGKNFIQDYIPKCHRPLQKKKGGKRTSFRQHEMGE